MTQPETITRVSHPLPMRDFYLDYFIARQPVTIRTNSLTDLDWRTDRWSNEYLVYKAGGQSVAVLRSENQDDFMPEKALYGIMPFQEFVTKVMANPDGNDTLYLNLQDFDKRYVLEMPLLQLIGDFSIPVYFKDLILRCMNIWMGNSRREIVTPLHHDFNANLYVVVDGHKHFTLFPPQQVTNLYTRGKLMGIEPNGTIRYESLKGMPHLSQVDIDHPDLNRFPRYADAEKTRLDFDLEKNEILFLPNG
ncbi:MAG: cupin-like domain-containing protein [Gammaproteobacteria bacterium]